MKLYHGTNTDFLAIDLNQSQRGKDFGCGFYLSESETQAEEMAKFKVQLFGGQSIVQGYEFDEARLSDGTLRFLRFDGYTKGEGQAFHVPADVGDILLTEVLRQQRLSHVDSTTETYVLRECCSLLHP